MNRRSFLQSILAAGVAPWVMSNGVAGGVLMPVRKMILSSPWADLVIYSGLPGQGGRELSRIPILNPESNLFMPSARSAPVLDAGTASHFRIEKNADIVLSGTVGTEGSDADIVLDAGHLQIGQAITLTSLSFSS